MVPEETPLGQNIADDYQPAVHPAPQPVPHTQRTSHGCFIAAVLLLLLLFALASLILIGSMLTGGIDIETVGGGDAVAVVRIEGVLTDGEQIVDEIKRYSNISAVKAIVMRIDSPGGFVVPCQEIHAALRRVREKEIPVVASMGTVAASGGYYVALGADKIVANPGTATGSIGVILSYPTFGDLFDKIGVSMERVKSGEFKGIGDPTRKLTERERAVLRERIDDVYQQFIDVVVEGRGLSEDEVRTLADGRVYSGRQAVGLGLVDVEGDMHDAIKLAAEEAGIPGEPKVLMKKRRGLFALLDAVETVAEAVRVSAMSPEQMPMFLMK